MADKLPPPTNQRAEVRPIAFAIDAGGVLSKPVTLNVRPEDLTRTEPSRLSVHQTLGNGQGVTGWVDNFGAGLPTVTLSGHTGWRRGSVGGEDGYEAFNTLNKLVMPQFHALKQAAVDSGIDPASVKLIFIDMLDGFTWSVVPTSFVLRRSKSRPLLLQYNISLQAVSTSIDDQFPMLPSMGGISAGLSSLNRSISLIQGFAPSVGGWVASAAKVDTSFPATIAGTVSKFLALSLSVYRIVGSTVASVINGFNSAANSVIRVASDISKIGINVFRTLSAIVGLPGTLRASLMRVATAFNAMACILSNSLRPRPTYEEYDGMFGASTCSSTTGGRMDSPYANMNAFKQMQPVPDPVRVSSVAQSSSATLRTSDPILRPLPSQEVSRHLTNVVGGLEFAT